MKTNRLHIQVQNLKKLKLIKNLAISNLIVVTITIAVLHKA